MPADALRRLATGQARVVDLVAQLGMAQSTVSAHLACLRDCGLFVNRQEIAAAFEDVFDQAIVFHGYAAHLRDYDVFIYATADPRTGIHPEHLRYRFTHCVRATATTAVPRDVWKRSLDDRLLDYQRYVEADDLEGYVWGVNWQGLYPGMTLLEESVEAAQGADDLGIPFHEARIKTNGHNLKLIFSDLLVTRVETGFAPFTVPHGGPDFKIPLS